ncbi:chromosome segregation protein SMC [Rhodospirillum rubrum]|uniref:chromosome segregation protein SMC n=1 Tax=Rhodospirillum rubrum TaxID=1085 RepID=UPI001908A802|nr:chromosome segregation protein SMC [Rhodospirillum rubrum]MBK1665607.1 chromosome segregation protein SMC [Rhodospirillum rubrum]MBK1677647.1 chromosome segregation protein SMC [Rhodospirillum rubrum]
MLHFTRLRLVGFKSFVEPAELMIEPGLTGVVGPNGCGKSNVVEALRWVMGETSAKQLRGEDMDDVIFGGTASRPPRNVAEVTLLLDNHEGGAPALFNAAQELEVTRRIARGDGSLYRVNGKDVRARDVQLLFADSATGARSTAMVSQGRVSALIAAKPAQRRALLEEAAGIGGLYSRRHEAELRLRAAEGNLARLEDVVTALDGQLGGLRRQARQAARYRALSEAIRQTEAALLRQRWLVAIRAVDGARRIFAEGGRELAVLSGRTVIASREQAAAEEAIGPIRSHEAEASARLQRLALAREQLEAESRRLAQTAQENHTRRTQAEADRARETARAADAEAAISRLEGERRAIEAKAAGDDAARREAEARLSAAEAGVAEADAALATATATLADLEARRAAQDRGLREAIARGAKVAARLAELEGQIRAAEGEAIAPGALEGAVHTRDRTVAALEAARERVESGEAARSAAQAAVDLAQDSLRRAEGRLTGLRAEARALEATLARAAPKGRTLPVVEALSVRPGGEKALASALGDDLDAGSAEEDAVRWVVLPALAADPPGATTPLADLVEGPEAVRALLARRLGRVGVVEDAAAAQALLPGLTPGQEVVDRAGGLWRWDGLVRRPGSRDGAALSAARLETRNRLGALVTEREDAEAALAEARDAHGTARTRLEAVAAEDRAAREAVRAGERQMGLARDALTTLERRAAASESRLATLGQALARAREDGAEAEAVVAAQSRALAALDDSAAARAAVAELRATLAERRTTLLEARATRDRVVREAEGRGRRLGALAAEITSWRARRDQAADQEAELTRRFAAAEATLAELVGRPEAIAAEKAALVEALRAAESDRLAARDALSAAERRLSEAGRALKEAERAEAQAREVQLRGEATLDQARLACQAAAAAIAEKFDCAPEALAAQAGLGADETLAPVAEAEVTLLRLGREREAMGPVNLRAEQEAGELDAQIASLRLERDDLVAAIARLRQGIGELNREGRSRLLESFQRVDGHFRTLFLKLFGGGRAHLTLIESDDPLEAGLEIMASPPGKRLQSLGLLSGGEQALTATALLFAVFLTNPAPICVLDEVDAPLDDANVDRFCAMLRHLTDTTGTRFLVVTHHRMTMARMDRLFGVTMAERGVSSLVSVDLCQAEDLVEGDGPAAVLA